MFDLHCHSIFSDGELIPAELLRRVAVLGYEAVAITDHADGSNLDLIVPRIRRVAEELNPHSPCRLIPGIEITHVPPPLIPELVKRARKLGAEIVVVHGESPVEPVAPGTNRAALEAGADILAHPGLISEEEVRLAADKGVFLELSGRRGHCLANGHVARLARELGAPLIINSDAHAPDDLMTRERAFLVGRGAGLSEEEVKDLYARARARFLRVS
ncbi:histidinol phosphate phosphatase domain-containing protein [Thermosulfurimonas sp. F29]|uniref:histidinol phosphate phosphatase domain-containing protein n=1 Tax=Thermosulfurimonas sp. F29 TaxID=2867247 RepID=UPI001C831B95|nr:histidinol phosphate phosphatase domain-containing protein [Thermosulfurimonas sp. F29]MBX6423640.1 histidinol phosphate phosphatase domain-containing protein [Thermosulfurimonas sp. F29]